MVAEIFLLLYGTYAIIMFGDYYYMDVVVGLNYNLHGCTSECDEGIKAWNEA